VKKSTPSLNRRDFLRLSILFTGGLVVSPLLRILDRQAIGLEDASAQVRLPGAIRLPSPLPPNPLLKQLGFKDTERVAIIEVEDVGLCEANLAAFNDLMDFGLVGSGRALVPSVWFPQVAHFARIHPGMDLGVNLTLSSEWEPMRWRPLSTVDPSSELMDDQGFFPKSRIHSPTFVTQVIAQEFKAQIQRAQGMGVRLTHLAMHQQFALDPAFLPSYLQAAQEARLPLLFLRPDETLWKALPAISAEWISAGMNASMQLAQQGAYLLDSIVDLTSTAPEARSELTRQAIDRLQAGVHLINLRAARDTPELRALTPDWQGYVADYQTWTSQELATHLRASGVQVIPWKAIQAIMPA
jgi:hypothetical protein